ncbi:MAG: (2Fe-2S)-binding protein [Alphaproteobacteria bacterium]|nr:(2Fe-2S)-binding protein [Alphaproteobacteria bacterium]
MKAGASRILARLADLASGPPTGATASPPGIYHDPEIHALERRAIFAREWQCVGLAAEIPHPGDYLDFSLDDQPIFVVRGEDLSIRGFSNVCLHRCMRLVAGRGTAKKIVCPYHAWTYDLEGRLHGAAHMARTPDFKVAGHALPTIRTEVWDGWIFATLDSKAPALGDRLAPLAAIVGPYRMADYIPFAAQDHVWATNWKILTENFMEGYHLPVAHRRTVGAWFPADDTGFPAERFEAFTYQTFIKDDNATYGRAHPDNPRLKGRWRSTSVMPTIYPALMYVLAPDHMWYLSLRPKSVDEVHVRFGAALAPEVLAALPDRESYFRETVDFFDRVNAEDKVIVEAIHQSTKAPLAASGRLSWLEREIHDFQGYLSRRLGTA